MARNYRKNQWAYITAIFLAVVLTVGLVAGIVALTGKKADEGKVIVKLDYEIGTINETGKYVESEKSIYSDAFECKGLKITLDFDNSIKYRIHFYDESNVHISTTAYLESGFPTTALTVPDTAFYARIEITPEWDSDVKAENRVVKWYNVNKYANQLTVQVDAEDAEVEESSEAA